MTEKIVNTNIEILGKFYPVRCKTSEIKALEEAADHLNKQMLEIQESGKVINLERIAIITALNITHQYLQLDQQKTNLMQKINHRITEIQNKLDEAINPLKQTELVYSMDAIEE